MGLVTKVVPRDKLMDECNADDGATHLQGLADGDPRHAPGRRRQPAPQLGRHGEARARALRNDVLALRCARGSRRRSRKNANPGSWKNFLIRTSDRHRRGFRQDRPRFQRLEGAGARRLPGRSPSRKSVEERAAGPEVSSGPCRDRRRYRRRIRRSKGRKRAGGRQAGGREARRRHGHPLQRFRRCGRGGPQAAERIRRFRCKRTASPCADRIASGS